MDRDDFGECSRENEERKPFKKAKYLWQVKGKYHLRNQCNTSPSESTEKPEDEDQCKGKCIDKFLERTQAILDSDDEEIVAKNIDKSIFNEIPITLVSPHHKGYDYYLQKWQARQIARGYIDNTINSVLEGWVSAPFDAEDFVDNCEDDGKVEDEGILMAIQAHGLQSSSHNSSTDHDGGGDIHSGNLLNAAIMAAIERKGLSSCNQEN